MNQDSSKITLATITNFFLGCMTFLCLDSPMRMILNFACILISPVFFSTRQGFFQVSKYTLTTAIFGIIDMYCLKNLQPFTVYLIVMSIYFYGEFQLVNCFHHQTLNWNSFLIYHSKHYTLANIAMLIEHGITRYVFDLSYKHSHIIMVPAFIVMMVGLLMRILAFFTAQRNFTHIIRTQRIPQHQLITHGIYKYLRHPSYTGFFYFSVASMLFIGNFFCTIAFAVTLQRFFQDRIQYEQYYLLKFFGKKYDQYRKQTHILIPFIKGYQMGQHQQ